MPCLSRWWYLQLKPQTGNETVCGPKTAPGGETTLMLTVVWCMRVGGRKSPQPLHSLDRVCHLDLSLSLKTALRARVGQSNPWGFRAPRPCVHLHFYTRRMARGGETTLMLAYLSRTRVPIPGAVCAKRPCPPRRQRSRTRARW